MSHACVFTPSIDGSTSGRSLPDSPLVHAVVPPRCAGTSPRAVYICCVEDLSQSAAAPLMDASRILSRNVFYYTS